MTTAEHLTRAALQLRRAASHGRPVTIDAAAAVAIADWLDSVARREFYMLAEFGYRTASAESVAAALAIVGEPS